MSNTFRALVVGLLCVGAALGAHAENMSVGFGGSGNFYLLDGHPELGTGVGGYAYFDYRWAPQISTQFSLNVTTQNGKGANVGDRDIMFLAVPSVDFKYYFQRSSSRIDPYALAGIGFYVTSEGTTSDGTTATGFGANLGLGLDWYLTPALAATTSATLRSIALINTFSGNNNGTAIFPLTVSGGLAFHF